MIIFYVIRYKYLMLKKFLMFVIVIILIVVSIVYLIENITLWFMVIINKIKLRFLGMCCFYRIFLFGIGFRGG